MNNKIEKLEAIRGLVAIIIAFFHILLIVPPLPPSMDWLMHAFGVIKELEVIQTMVIIFFILSGFVIYLSSSRSKNQSFGLYFTKRFLRIYVPFICIILVHIWVTFYVHPDAEIDYYQLWGNLLMQQDFNKLFNDVQPFMSNIPLWSLSYEWWFYMLFFFIYKIFKDKSSLFVYAFSIIAALIFALWRPSILNRIPMYMSIWWMGVEMAKLYVANKRITAKNMKWSILTVVICLLILIGNMTYRNIPLQQSLEMINFTQALIIIAAALAWRNANWKWFDKLVMPFRRLAPISYGIYISHWVFVMFFPSIDFGDAMGPMLSFWLNIAWKFALCLLFSYLAERVIYTRINNFVMKYCFPKIYKSKKIEVIK